MDNNVCGQSQSKIVVNTHIIVCCGKSLSMLTEEINYSERLIDIS